MIICQGTGSSIGKKSFYSRKGSSYASSGISDISGDRLSLREVGKLKRWMKDKEKWDRRNNIVIKGVSMEGDEKEIRENMKGWVDNFLKERLDVKVNIESCRISG